MQEAEKTGYPPAVQELLMRFAFDPDHDPTPEEVASLPERERGIIEDWRGGAGRD